MSVNTGSVKEMIRKQYPVCLQGRANCFAFEELRCKVLKDTKFNYDCPFYKEEEQYEKELKKYGGLKK